MTQIVRQNLEQFEAREEPDRRPWLVAPQRPPIFSLAARALFGAGLTRRGKIGGVLGFAVAVAIVVGIYLGVPAR